MTERKPPGIGFETWVERQIREATERGEFSNLPGAGKPIPDLDKPHDELWWIRRKLRREDLSYLPPTIALRKEAEDALAAAHRAGTEGEVRRIGSIEGVGVYREVGTVGVPGVVYLPVTRDGTFQPYQNMTGDGCP